MYKRTKNHGSGPFSRELSYPPFSSKKISFVSTMVGIFTITTSKNEGGDAKKKGGVGGSNFFIYYRRRDNI